MVDADTQTRFFELTHRGRGAVAVMSLQGINAESILDKCFNSITGKPLSSIDRSIIYGTWKSSGEDLIVVRLSCDKFEIQCHGGAIAIESIKQSLLQLDAVAFDDRDQWNSVHNIGWWKSGTLDQLCTSKTDRTAKLLLQQLELCSHFFESAISSIESGDPKRREQLSYQLLTASQWGAFGIHLTEPWTVVFCGKPNAGKSSLVNALAGFERSIVHQSAGTTRDVLSHLTAIDGWPVELKDTAGLRESVHKVEGLGVEKAKSEISAADVTALVIDASQVDSNSDFVENQVLELAPNLLVINKTDLLDGDQVLANGNYSLPTIFTSTVDHLGLTVLQNAISTCIVPTLPDADQLVPVSQAQVDFVQKLIDRLHSQEWDSASEMLKEIAIQ